MMVHHMGTCIRLPATRCLLLPLQQARSRTATPACWLQPVLMLQRLSLPEA